MLLNAPRTRDGRRPSGCGGRPARAKRSRLWMVLACAAGLAGGGAEQPDATGGHHRALQAGEAAFSNRASPAVGSTCSCSGLSNPAAACSDPAAVCVNRNAELRQLFETQGLLSGQVASVPAGTNPDRLCEYIRDESGIPGTDIWGNLLPAGTPGTCDGSVNGESVGTLGGSLNELCPCSCPHVLNVCGEGARTSSSLPGLLGLRITAEAESASGTCVLLLWAGWDDHPVLTLGQSVPGVTVTVYDGSDSSAPRIGSKAITGSGSRLLVQVAYDAALVSPQDGLLQLGSWSTSPGSCTNGRQDVGEQGVDCGGSCATACGPAPQHSRICPDPLAANYQRAADAGATALVTGPEYRDSCQYDCDSLGQQVARLRQSSDWALALYAREDGSDSDITSLVQGASPAVCTDPSGFTSVLQTAGDAVRVLLITEDMAELLPAVNNVLSVWDFGGLVIQGDPSLPTFASRLDLGYGFQLLGRLVTFTGGTAVSAGGAVSVGNAGYASFEQCHFRDSSADHQGGAIRLMPGATLEMAHSVVHHCSAAEGGGIYAAGAIIRIATSTFVGNFATVDTTVEGSGQGGAIWVNAGTVEMTDTTFEDNHIDSPVDLPGDPGSISWYAGEGETLRLASSFGNLLSSLRVCDVSFEPFHDARTIFTTGVGPAGCVENPCDPGEQCSYSKFSLSCARCGDNLVGLDGVACSVIFH